MKSGVRPQAFSKGSTKIRTREDLTGIVARERAAGSREIARPQGDDPGGPDEALFKDPRSKPLGPLARTRGHYKGLYLHDHNVLLSYSVGDCDVLEIPGYQRIGETPVFTAPVPAIFCALSQCSCTFPFSIRRTSKEL